MITKLPKVSKEYQFSLICECPECNEFYHFNPPTMNVRGREHKGVRWLQGRCDHGHLYRNFDVDFIQPTSPFYRLLYTFDNDEYNKNKKIAQQKEEARKAELDKKYYEKFRGTQKSTLTLTEKIIRKEVLNGD